MLKQSTARNLMVFLVSSADYVSPVTGATLTITLSKAGGAFATITPTVTERGNGWYSLALTTAHTDTLGDFVLRITATGADSINLREEVFALLPGEAVTVATGGIASTSFAAGAINAAAIATDAIGSTQLAASAVTELQAGLALSTQVDALENDTTTLLARLTAGRAGNLDNLDAAISTRLASAGYTAPDNAGISTLTTRLTSGRASNLDNLDAAISTRLASAGYTAPANADIAAIKAKTDQLAFTVAGHVDVNVLRMNGAQVQGNGTAGDLWRGV
jgi:hypothetical protein